MEEVVFRGVLLHLWAKRWGVWRAALGTSALFGAMHIQGAFSAFVFGMTMVALYVRTGSLLIPIGAHMLHNLALTMTGFGPDSDPVTLERLAADAPLFLGLFVASLAIVVIVVRFASARPWRIPTAERSRTGSSGALDAALPQSVQLN